MVTDLIIFVRNNIGLSIILGFLLIFILVPITLDLIDQKRMIKPERVTEQKVDSFQSYISTADGPVGYGKSTFVSAKVHYLAIKLFKKMESTISEFRRLNWKVDYNELDSEILKLSRLGCKTYEVVETITAKYSYLFFKFKRASCIERSSSKTNLFLAKLNSAKLSGKCILEIAVFISHNEYFSNK